jgi:hypothetical protein
MFSPRTRWVGLRLNRCGSFAHVLQVGCTLGLIRYRFHKAAISYTQLNEPHRSLTIQQVRHIRTCQRGRNELAKRLGVTTAAI